MSYLPLAHSLTNYLPLFLKCIGHHNYFLLREVISGLKEKHLILMLLWFLQHLMKESYLLYLDEVEFWLVPLRLKHPKIFLILKVAKKRSTTSSTLSIIIFLQKLFLKKTSFPPSLAFALW